MITVYLFSSKSTLETVIDSFDLAGSQTDKNSPRQGWHIGLPIYRLSRYIGKTDISALFKISAIGIGKSQD